MQNLTQTQTLTLMSRPLVYGNTMEKFALTFVFAQCEIILIKQLILVNEHLHSTFSLLFPKVSTVSSNERHRENLYHMLLSMPGSVTGRIIIIFLEGGGV